MFLPNLLMNWKDLLSMLELILLFLPLAIQLAIDE